MESYIHLKIKYKTKLISNLHTTINNIIIKLKTYDINQSIDTSNKSTISYCTISFFFAFDSKPSFLF